MAARFLDTLRSLIGEDQVLAGGDLERYERDWRGRSRGRALAVARPADAAQVAAVVRACAERRVALVPQGGNTGLVGGSIPDDSGQWLVLSLERLRAIRSIDVDNSTVTVEAGCILQALHDTVAARGLLYPLTLGSQGSCTVGGNLATNAGGTQVLRYGNARELCLGLEVVTASGEIWSGLGGLRKDNTGYDLRDLFIGSEGTLGIITAATLKLFPQPASTCVALVACRDVEAALALLRLARQQLGAGLTGFELMSGHALALVARHFPDLPRLLADATFTVLIDTASTQGDGAQAPLEHTVAAALAQDLAQDAIVAASSRQSELLWAVRETIPLAQAREGLNAKHDIALPVSAIPDFLREMERNLPRLVPGIRPVVFGHLGDGNLHFNLQAPEGIEPAHFLRDHEAALNQCVHDAVQARGGSFSAEHGIGALKARELAARKSPVALGLMRSLKQALDPLGILNPGRVLEQPDLPAL